MSAPSSASAIRMSDNAAQALQDFVDDEMLRAPMLFDQLIDNSVVMIRRDLAQMPPALRSGAADLLRTLDTGRELLAQAFLRSLAQSTAARLDSLPQQKADQSSPGRAKPLNLCLVDETEVAIDVELAHAVERIKSEAEFELRELHTYTAALVGDMDMRNDHNPFSAETFARALWAAAQALPLSQGQQVQFMRQAGMPLAALLRQSYAAATSRLETQGIEPASYRTVILPSGARSSRSVDSSIVPDLRRLSESLAMTATLVDSTQSSRRAAPQRTSGSQAQVLVAALFEGIRQDERVPADVLSLVMRLHAPALQLAEIDAQSLLDEAHPLWVFINRLAYEAEMVPDAADPERTRLLRTSQTTVDRLAAEPQQTAALYIWGSHTLNVLMNQRLAQRCELLASQIQALQALEDRLLNDEPYLSTLNGALDTPNLDTVPAELMPSTDAAQPAAAQRWLNELRVGDWIRLVLQGRWLHAQVLWPGERRELWLLGDGATDATWAIRQRALVQLFEAGLLKKLKQRSLVGRAARALQERAEVKAA